MLPGFQALKYHRTILTHDNVIFMTGGLDPKKSMPSNRCFIMDADSHLVSEICSMNVARIDHNMVFQNGLIFVIGGVSSKGLVTSSCEVFDPQNNSWNKIGKLKYPSHSSTVVVFNQKIYKFGGKDNEDELIQKIEVFNGSRWTTVNFDITRLQLYSNSVCFPISDSVLILAGGTGY